MEEIISQAQGLDPFSRNVLEFSRVLELLRGYLTGAISGPRLAGLEPHTRIDEIRRDLERAGEAREYLRANSRPGLGALSDPRPILDKLRVEDLVLAALEIFALVEVARAALDFRKLFAKVTLACLAELAAALPDLRSLVAELAGKILPDGSVDSSASPALARIRRDTERLREELQSTLEKLLGRLTRNQVVQDAVVTLRNDRLVIPVRSEEKRRVAGVVHGASSSGATVYIEPLETVPLNNELVELQEKEFVEIQRILAEFSGKLRERREELSSATSILSEFDFVFAKAEFAREYDCCIPQLAAERVLSLRGVRHPLLEKTLRAQHRRSVPLTLELSAPKSLMIMSGPNTGGKTVALKSVGIAVLMAQAGLPVPADEARLPLFGRVLADIGDQQSIQANLSTFSAHIKNIQSMIEVADKNDLVLLDELGSSTEPSEGAALAVALLDHFRGLQAMTLVTTHHSRLKAYAAETPEALNAAMEFDEATLQPTYRVLLGLPGKSSALDIAARLGLDPSVVARARSVLHAADAEAATLIARLHEQHAELERSRAELEAQRKDLESREQARQQQFEQERRARLKDLDARLESTLRQAESNFEKAVSEVRPGESVAKKLGRKAAAVKTEAREEWNAQVLEVLGAPAEVEEALSEAPAAVGDRVRVASLSSSGTVTALLNDGRLEVEVGRMRMRLERDEVRVVASRAPATAAAVYDARSADHSGDVPLELNVIGTTADEARDLVDKFLDQAYVAGRLHLRIVHGHGKGILRKALHEMLATHPHVEKFAAAPPNEGGAGATMVELKM